MSAKVPRFIAIPVGQGDAFYLETRYGSVLVDGGRAISGFAELFAQTTGAKGADVVICTHNDADHANGIIGFLQAGLECREVWLPGRWLGVLPHVANPTPEVPEALAEQACKVAQKRRQDLQKRRDIGTLLELYGDFLAQKAAGHTEEKDFTPPNIPPAEGTNAWPQALAGNLEQAVRGEWGKDWWGPREWPLGLIRNRSHELLLYQNPRYRRIWHVVSKDHVASALFRNALSAAERIRRIAVAAYHRGVAVRWFEYAADSPHGGTRWLRPVNAKEVAYVPPAPKDQLLSGLAFTTANRESLVFWADMGDSPGVLFTADSDLKDVNLSNLSAAIVTAPHHGSQANANAYSKIRQHLVESERGITWVRSDGRFRTRPGPEFMAAPGRRFCTICRNAAPQPKQAVRLFLRKLTWVRSPRTRQCNCC